MDACAKIRIIILRYIMRRAFMKQMMQKISILSLSFMLITTYAVSVALPAMQEYYVGYSRASVEQLVSITSFAMTIVIIFNLWLSKFLSQRVSITLGILLLMISGSAPVFVQNYHFVLVTRILLGVGIGLVNSHAINLINEFYEGAERAALLGFRSAVEVLGNAILTLVAGWLLTFGWSKAFAIYLTAILVLILYYCFVPKQKKTAAKQEHVEKVTAADIKKHLPALISILALGYFTISINSAITMRIPVLTLERNLGTDSQSSLVLSLMMMTGVVSGICFGKMLQLLKSRLMGVCMLFLGGSLLLVGVSGHIFLLTAGAMISGISYNLLATLVFHRVSEKLPAHVMRIGTTCGLVGCNMGAFTSPYVMKLMELVNDSSHTPLMMMAAISIVLGGVMLFAGKKK